MHQNFRSTQHNRKQQSGLTLRRLLIIPFVGQMLLVTGLVSYWSLNAGRQTVNQLVTDLSAQTSLEIKQHLEHYLLDARTLTEINATQFSQS